MHQYDSVWLFWENIILFQENIFKIIKITDAFQFHSTVSNNVLGMLWKWSEAGLINISSKLNYDSPINTLHYFTLCVGLLITNNFIFNEMSKIYKISTNYWPLFVFSVIYSSATVMLDLSSFEGIWHQMH